MMTAKKPHNTKTLTILLIAVAGVVVIILPMFFVPIVTALNITTIIANIALTALPIMAFFGKESWEDWKKKDTDRKAKNQAYVVDKDDKKIAEDALALFYEARDVISAIRSPFGLSGEGSSRKQNDHETNEQKQLLDNAYVIIERYMKNQELFNKINSLRYRFKARFEGRIGQNVIHPFDDLNKVINELIGASRALSRYWPQLGKSMSQNRLDHTVKMINEYEATFWEGIEDEDPIKPKVDKIIEDIEEICKEIITGESSGDV